MDQDNPLFFGKNLFTLELKVPELLELAAWMERTGAEYYRYLSEQTQDYPTKKFFLRLMGMEHEHELHIRKLYQEAASKELDYFGEEEGVTGRDFLQRVRKAALKKVWPGGFDPTMEVKDKFEIRESLQMALDAEKNSAALYHYLGKFKLYGPARDCIDRLKKDEQGHIRDIIDVMQKLPNGEIGA